MRLLVFSVWRRTCHFFILAEQLELFLKGEQTEDDNEPAGESAQ
jgi:hypothetical protein